MTAVDYRNGTTLLTGASSGIGTEFAHQLARRGSDLVLVARRRDRLETLAKELISAHGIRVTVIPLDLSAPSAGLTLAGEVSRRGIRLSSLVNCAGFGTFGPFHEEHADRLEQEIAVDVAAVVDLSRAFIDQLRAAGNGVLINVASMAAYAPTPNMAVYAATKAFVLNFTEALWQESRGTGLRVIALSPGATATEFFDVVGTMDTSNGRRLQTPKEVVDTALRTLDRRNPPPSVVVGRLNRMATVAGRLLSRRLVVRAMASATKQSGAEVSPRPA
ncbi:SDR family NAD(P)-dependent oxidoreductase [Streptomyces sp. NPDC020681]|uniref:SDR family NAD(P)-dependent oxidoreductase n=1 Tax=Streptomyces sp. NPDC020681 TaxID=3365083 RepID=UPI0037ADFC6B